MSLCCILMLFCFHPCGFLMSLSSHFASHCSHCVSLCMQNASSISLSFTASETRLIKHIFFPAVLILSHFVVIWCLFELFFISVDTFASPFSHLKSDDMISQLLMIIFNHLFELSVPLQLFCGNFLSCNDGFGLHLWQWNSPFAVGGVSCSLRPRRCQRWLDTCGGVSRLRSLGVIQCSSSAAV